MVQVLERAGEKSELAKIPAHVAVRNIRHQGLKDLDELEEEKLISEDQHFRGKDMLQELTDKYIKLADEVGKKKQDEVMEV